MKPIRIGLTLLALYGLVSTAAADRVVGPPQLVHTYEFVGLKKCEGYSFFVVESVVKRGVDEAQVKIVRLEEGVAFQPKATRWNITATWTIYAVTGDVPETVTAQWLEKAPGACAAYKFAAMVPRPDDQKDAKRQTTTLALSLEKTAAGATALVVTASRIVLYDNDGKVLRTVEGEKGSKPFETPVFGDQGFAPRRGDVDTSSMWLVLMAVVGLLGAAAFCLRRA